MTSIGTATVTASRGVNAHGLPVAPRKRRKDATKLTEREFMAQVVALAKLHGWLVYHTHDSRRSEAGFPDLVMIKGKRIIVAELKADGGKLSPEQERWLEAFRATAVEEWAWWPQDWPVIEQLLSK